MDLLKKARRLLKQAFPTPAKISLKEEDGIMGVVISSRFEGLEGVDRQKILGDVLDQNLTADERRQIVIIIAVTPEEEIAHAS